MNFLMKAAIGGLMVVQATVVQAQTTFGPDDADETYYWISQASTLPLFVRTDFKGLDRIANELGIEVKVAGPTNIDLGAFIATIDQVCAQRPAGVVVVGWDPALTESVNNCIKLGVPTVTDDADLPDSDRLAFVGTNWENIGIQMAKVVVEQYPEGGKVAMMSIINAGIMQDAVRGYTNYLEAADGDYEVVANEDDKGDSLRAAEITSAILAANPDVIAFAGFDSESGAGIVRALAEAGASNDLVVTAMEQSPEFMETVRDGTVDAIIVQNRELFTYYAIRMLYDFNHNGLTTNGLAGWEGQPVQVNIDTGVLVIDSSNVEKMIKAMADSE
jgi:ribose transport system substrate-binding protein